MKKLLFLLPLLIIYAGCATSGGNKVVDNVGELPSIQRVYSKQLSELHIGSSFTEFERVFPQAYIAGKNGKTTGYELKYTQSYVTQADIDYQNFMWGCGSPKPHSHSQVLWFYFYNNKLII